MAKQHSFPRDFATAQDAIDLTTGLIAHPRIFGVVAEQDGLIVGSNFLDQRSTIRSVGPLTVDPTIHARGIGRALMRAALDEYTRHPAAGLRLVQVAYNTASVAMYASLGFDVREQFAALQGPAIQAEIAGSTVRPATAADVGICDQLCLRVHGHDRGGELRDAVHEGVATIVERSGRISGYSTGIGLFAHAVAETNDDLIALISAANEFSGPGFLVPMRNTDLLRWCLSQGLRISHMLNLMTIGLYHEPQGAYLASIGY